MVSRPPLSGDRGFVSVKGLLVVSCFAALGLALSACGGDDTAVPTVVEQGWSTCIATDMSQDVEGLYAGIKPDGASLPNDLTGLSTQHSPPREKVTYTGSVQGVRFVCVYNTYAGIASLAWAP